MGLGNRSLQVFDAKENILSLTRTNAAGSILTSARYEYNQLGQMRAAYDHHNFPVRVGYDLLGRKTFLESVDSGRKEYAYTPSGLLDYETDSLLRSRGQRINYRYDGLGRLLEIRYPQSPATVYTYGPPNAPNNAAGRILTIKDESGLIEFEYGALGETTAERRTLTRLTAGASPETAVMRYTGDYLGRMQRIEYPDGEIVTYGYDHGGQLNRVTGSRNGGTFNYVNDIAYDEFGQRVFIEYGNSVRSYYTYDPDRRWLSTLRTEYTGAYGSLQYQNITYNFDRVGNVASYINNVPSYQTEQKYTYDSLYQLTGVQGTHTSRENGMSIDYTAAYNQSFAFDTIGNMTAKNSRGTNSSNRVTGANLNYDLDYSYYPGYAHRLERAGNRYYRYDANGNLISERDGGHAPVDETNVVVTEHEGVWSTDYGFALSRPKPPAGNTYQRNYTWNERNLMIRSSDPQIQVDYRYGADGQRTIKHSSLGEVMYFNTMWSVQTDIHAKLLQSKHIFVGSSRIVTKRNYKDESNLQYEKIHQYYYHTDHLNSVQTVTDYEGRRFERLEYTPYGELWIEKRYSAIEKTPFRFTGKELDPETGLYYYGARYLDPKYSRWLSTDPALGEYIPGAPINEEARKRNGNLPGLGGVYNTVNLHLYHYAGNNPVKFIDPDGRDIKEIPVYTTSIGVLGAIRFTAGVAIDSNANMAVYAKFEAGIGFGVTVVDDSVVNLLGLSKIRDLGTLRDSLDVLKDSSHGIVNISSVSKYPEFIYATDFTAVTLPFLADGGNPPSVTVVTRTVL